MSRDNLFHPPKGEKDHHAYRTSLEESIAPHLNNLTDFISDQITTSVLLVLFGVIAVVWASIDALAPLYNELVNFKIGLVLGSMNPTISLKTFVNDFLMAIFFFFLGLEVKREFIGGELAKQSVRNSVLFAAIGGMLFPALIFILLSPDKYDLQGWGIPIATDTAFALGILALLKSRLPISIFSFVAALAVIDDLGAIIVLAIFYTQPPVPFYILLSAICFLILILFNMFGIRRYLPYIIVGIFLWLFVEHAGIHGTVAGVLLALTIPSRPKTGPRKFVRKLENLTRTFQKRETQQKSTIIEDHKKQELIEQVEDLAVDTASPLSRLQHIIEPSVFIFILPLFALLNTGIPISMDKILTAHEHTLTRDIFLALIFGKCIGISLCTWLICKLKIGRLPQGLRFGHVIGLSLLAGIGFTMSIFIGEISFGDSPEIVFVKMGIFSASILAAVLGYFFLLFYSKFTQGKS